MVQVFVDTGVNDELINKIYESRTVLDKAGQAHPLEAEISPEFAAALYRTVLLHKPRLVVEVGMAHGLSTLVILMALRDAKNGGQLISIDPLQHSTYKGIGLTSVERSGLESQHRLIDKSDYLALPHLLEEKTQIDFAYIDGWHTFDYVMLDFFFLDKMTRVGGVIGFNDCGYRAIHKALSFVRTHRKYTELDVGLKPDFRAATPLLSGARRILRRSSSDRYFQKTADWEPAWNFYAHF